MKRVKSTVFYVGRDNETFTVEDEENEKTTEKTNKKKVRWLSKKPSRQFKLNKTCELGEPKIFIKIVLAVLLRKINANIGLPNHVKKNQLPQCSLTFNRQNQLMTSKNLPSLVP